MKIEKNIIDWNKAPFSVDNKISKEVRQAIYDRFNDLLVDLKNRNQYRKLQLSDGWVITAKDNVVFVINPIKNEDIPNNVDLKDETLKSDELGAKARRIRDKVWDCEKYSELTSIVGLSIDPNTGKISYKVL